MWGSEVNLANNYPDPMTTAAGVRPVLDPYLLYAILENNSTNLGYLGKHAEQWKIVVFPMKLVYDSISQLILKILDN